MTVDAKDCLDRFGQLIIDARDETLDAAGSIFDEDTRDSVASFIRSTYRSSGPSKEELHSIIANYVDQAIYNIAYNIQDSKVACGLTLHLDCGNGSEDINLVSDGLAGEFMTEVGWIAKKSRHGRNRFER